MTRCVMRDAFALTRETDTFQIGVCHHQNTEVRERKEETTKEQD